GNFIANYEGDFTGTLTVAHTATIVIGVAQDFAGTFIAPEDLAASPTGGIINSLHVGGDMTASSLIDAGPIFDATFDGNVNGVISAHGQGTIGSLSVGGALTGSVTAYDTSTQQGSIGSLSAGAVGTTGTVSTGDLTSMT